MKIMDEPRPTEQFQSPQVHVHNHIGGSSPPPRRFGHFGWRTILILVLILVVALLVAALWFGGSTATVHHEVTSQQVEPVKLEAWVLSDDLPFGYSVASVNSKTYRKADFTINLKLPLNVYKFKWKLWSSQDTRHVTGPVNDQWLLSHNAASGELNPATGVLTVSIDAQKIDPITGDPGIRIEPFQHFSIKRELLDQNGQQPKPPTGLNVGGGDGFWTRQIASFESSNATPGLDSAAEQYATLQASSSACLQQVVQYHPLDQSIAQALQDWANVLNPGRVKQVKIVWLTPFDPSYGDRMIQTFSGEMTATHSDWHFQPPQSLKCTADDSFKTPTPAPGAIGPAPSTTTVPPVSTPQA